LLILELWGISFHAVVVFGLGKNLLFKSILGLCDWKLEKNCDIFVPYLLKQNKQGYGNRYNEKVHGHKKIVLSCKAVETGII
jgi:hypothetical protein